MILVFNDRMFKKIFNWNFNFFVITIFLSVIDRSNMSFRLGQGMIPGTVEIINISYFGENKKYIFVLVN